MPSLSEIINTVFQQLREWLNRGEFNSDYARVLVNMAANEFKRNPRLGDEILKRPLNEVSPELLAILKQAAIQAGKDKVELKDNTATFIKRIDDRIKEVTSQYTDSIERARAVELKRQRIAKELDDLLSKAKGTQPLSAAAAQNERGRMAQNEGNDRPT